MKFLILVAGICSSVFVMAGPGVVGNGGGGILVNDRVYLLDLVESACEKNIFIDENIEKPPFIQTERVLSLDPNILGVLNQKLAEIHQLDQPFAYSILKMAELLRWSFVNHRLKDVIDPTPIIIEEPMKYVQIAVRLNDNVMIDKMYWDKMDDGNKAALVVHEILNAMITWVFDQSQNRLIQSGLQVRQMVGLLFSKELGTLAIADFRGRLYSLFPNTIVLYEKASYLPENMRNDFLSFTQYGREGYTSRYLPQIRINSVSFGYQELMESSGQSHNVWEKLCQFPEATVDLMDYVLDFKNMNLPNGGGYVWGFSRVRLKQFTSSEVSQLCESFTAFKTYMNQFFSTYSIQ